MIAAVLAVASLAVSLHAQAIFPALSSTAALSKPITASATCGLSFRSDCAAGVTGASCYACNATCPFITGVPVSGFNTTAAANCFCATPGCQRVNVDARPIQYANDGTLATYWQSPDLTPLVNVSLDMLWEQEVVQVSVKFNTPVPKAVVLLRSTDGVSYTPYQYYSVDCAAEFGLSTAMPSSPEAPACSTVTVTDSALTFTPLTGRAGASAYATNEALQRFTRARYLRLAFVKYFSAADAQDQFDPTFYSDHHDFYMVTELAVRARCSCNGHASDCVQFGNGDYGCVCDHNTAGLNCASCKPLYNRKPYLRGIDTAANACVACNCNNHAASCSYNATLDSAPASRINGDGGVCTNCVDNTFGQNCQSCVTKFYETPGVAREALNACSACACSVAGTIDGGVSPCVVKTGQCACKAHTVGRDCGTCEPEFYGLRSSNPDGCASCVCNLFGTASSSNVCDAVSGQCPCKASNEGRDCGSCAAGFFRPNGSAVGVCQACNSECGAEGCTAFGPDKCLACLRASEAGVCVKACNPDRYPGPGKACVDCSDECLGGCTGPEATNATCVQCRHYQLLSGSCVAECPPQTYADIQNICQPCDAQCLGCTGPAPTQCLVCRADKDNAACVAACPANKYSAAGRQCSPCHVLCDQTVGCTGPAASECKACAAVWKIDAVAPAACALSCDGFNYPAIETFRGRPNTAVCHACDAECAIACNGATAAQCVGGCVHYTFGQTCVAACPAQTYVKSGAICDPCAPGCNQAQGCSGPLATQCVACAAKAVSHLGTQCLTACPIGFYADAQRVCQPCDALCVACTGPTAAQCSVCAAAAFEGFCVSMCPVLLSFQSNANVNSAVGVATTVLLAPQYCIPCHEECADAGCTGVADSQCTSCAHVTWQGRCVAACPVLHFAAIDVCYPCNTECATGCTSAASTSCAACAHFNDAGSCVATCPAHRYVEGANCRTCHAQCSLIVPGCQGPAAAQCSACAAFNDTTTGNCVGTCPFGTYRAGGQCLPCNSNCDGCTGPLTTQCLACRGFLNDLTCVPDCPVGRYGSAAKACLDCHPECKDDCDGPSASQCVTLSSLTGCVRVRQEITCVAACDPAKFFLPAASTVCARCSPQCDQSGCTGALASQCVKCASVSFQGTCLLNCPNNHYPDVNKVCQPCGSQCTVLNAPVDGFLSPYCTGPGNNQCTSCVAVKRGDTCVATCNFTAEFVFPSANGGAATCVACHPECSNGCSGTLATQCTACRRVNYNGTCVASCPSDSTYTSGGQCLACHPLCNTATGSGGCPAGGAANNCVQCLATRNSGVCAAVCPVNMFPDQAVSAVAVALGGDCTLCHAQCNAALGCAGPLPSQCNTCKALSYLGTCLSTCPALTFTNGAVCVDCHINCVLGCTGTGVGACVRQAGQALTTSTTLGCRIVALYNANSGAAQCLSVCPVGTFADANNLCQQCHITCATALGCTGPAENECVACASTQFLDRLAASCAACSVQCKGGCSDGTPGACVACKGARKDGVCVTDCAAFSLTHFTDTSNALENRCVPCDGECSGGCSGAGPAKCASCARFVTSSGVCIASCANGYVPNGLDAKQCRTCDALCVGGCTGPSPSQCAACALARLRNGTCAAVCPANEAKDSSNMCACPVATAVVVDNTCMLCHAQCAAGCTGTAATQCLPPSGAVSGAAANPCRNARARDGSCVASCPSLEAIDASKNCNCPTATAVVVGGVCVACAGECGPLGCTGPLASQCLGMPAGCRSAFSTGACVAACPANETLPTAGDRSCGCKPLYFRNSITNRCLQCDDECAGGCSGGLPSQCTRCLHYSSLGSCVSVCPALEAPGAADDVCAACHPQCASGCRGPNDATLCGVTADASSSSNCRLYISEGACVSQCPSGQAPLSSTGECVAASKTDSAKTILIVVCAVLAAFALLAFFGILYVRRERRTGGMALASASGAGASGTLPLTATRPVASTPASKLSKQQQRQSKSSMIFDASYDTPAFQRGLGGRSGAGNVHTNQAWEQSYVDPTYMEVNTPRAGQGQGGFYGESDNYAVGASSPMSGSLYGGSAHHSDIESTHM